MRYKNKLTVIKLKVKVIKRGLRTLVEKSSSKRTL